jgi:Meiotically up-regulated gene 113
MTSTETRFAVALAAYEKAIGTNSYRGYRRRQSAGHASVFLYFIQAGEIGPIKIGYSHDPATRLAELQIGNPEELRLLGAFEGPLQGIEAMEAGWHYVFWAARIRGEWFKPIPKLLAAIDGWNRGIDLGCMEPIDETDC